ncbi:MAG: Methionine aminopeptidase [Candidatus Gottesmanbacteria bacterium GW2011_GWA2_41_12]|uniref:Methionine aminopeptidase n=2 Tax=Candidatus Gottesmaniibacteriota TaxID=1752720 RepID=A0A0G0UI44_9BACT|nr:MAG: Methionine aminopeptidase [Candidatus Gottesmanbacteria bacterium GW2011_GWC2_39_8]KKR88499.1 MAG: Methionine aminopeptidase [Candidatus Gottesmanbacteria bacterium GW2011_GWA2_41_12]
MIKYKTDEEIEIMQKGGKILKDVLDLLVREAKPGVTLLSLDTLAETEIRKRGAEPSFSKIPGYRWTTCLCLNDVVVHGIPTDYKLKAGDVLGIDVGVYLQGFHTDTSWSIIVGDETGSRKENQEKFKFLKKGEEALFKALKEVKPGKRTWDISKVIQDTVEEGGYSVVRSLVGHGVGRDLHEDPEIPGFIKHAKSKTPEIKEGMVIAVEVIYNLGSPEVIYNTNDGWTISTIDGKISGLFEKTVAVTSHGTLFLT